MVHRARSSNKHNVDWNVKGFFFFNTTPVVQHQNRWSLLVVSRLAKRTSHRWLCSRVLPYVLRICLRRGHLSRLLGLPRKGVVRRRGRLGFLDKATGTTTVACGHGRGSEREGPEDCQHLEWMLTHVTGVSRSVAGRGGGKRKNKLRCATRTIHQRTKSRGERHDGRAHY